MLCPACGSENPPDSRFCQRCGVRLEVDENLPSGERMPCPVCGKMTPAGFAFCQYCGSRLQETGQPVPAVEPTPPAGIPKPDTASWHSDTVESSAGAHQKTVSGLVAPPVVSSPASQPVLQVMDLTMTETTTYRIDELPFDIGRTEGHVTFPEDPYLSARHMRIQAGSSGFQVLDLDTPNGVYLKLRSKMLLGSPAWLLLGNQLLRLEILERWEVTLRPAYWHGVRLMGSKPPPAWGRLTVLTEAGTPLDVYYLARPKVVLGASEGDVRLYWDPIVSTRHAALSFDGRACVLEDLGSDYGTFVRIAGPTAIRSGDVLRAGVHLLRFHTRGKIDQSS